ncbi:MAG: glutamate-1-semialdehyde 2,1-aminomutase [Acidimicrobiia bacterium]|nr:glutamate-1-semialdehyde 2,1-aminomutase [Acidimicrobiia bacterium]
MPGGVNSPVRAFGAVGGNPPVVEAASGSIVRDVDGREWIDYISSWGAVILGHADPGVVAAVQEATARGTSFGLLTEAEVALAELVVDMVPSLDMVRWVSSGTEATMSALRLARAATGRDHVIKFSGCYHGHADSFLVAAGSGAATHGTPDSPGVPDALAGLTLLARYNDLNSVALAFEAEPIAAVIVEPVAGNMGCVPPETGFLEGLREMCTEHGSILIFDEVMTGFRLAPGGAQELFGVLPDLTTLGKVIGHGVPAAAYGGRADLMSLVSPAGSVYQAGTLAGNPLAVAAGLCTLQRLAAEPEIYDEIERHSARLEDGLSDAIVALDIPARVQRVGSMWTVFMSDMPVREFADTDAADLDAFARFFTAAYEDGVLLPPSAFETAFTTSAHEDDTVEHTIDVLTRALDRAWT